MEGGNDYSTGFVWPQRNYSCSFCKRQFNSAQALGGHMNVHRRDRAMLIQLPSWVFDHCSNPNPKSLANPNLSSSSATSATNLFPDRNCTRQYPFHRLSSASSSPVSASLTSSSGGDKKLSDQFESSVPLFEDLAKKKKRKNAVEMDKFKKDRCGYDQIEVLKQNHEVISLDLEIGFKDSKEVLDLELRLGCF